MGRSGVHDAGAGMARSEPGTCEPLRAAVAFRELTRGGSFREAATPAAILLAEAAARRYWVEPDLLREGAVDRADRRADRAAEARAVIDSLTPVSRRFPPTDFRTRLLTAWAATDEPPNP